MTMTGPDFLALQIRNLDRSAEFYETRLGLRRLPTSPPGAVVFYTKPVPFAIRDPLPSTDLDSAAVAVPIASSPVDGPFGRMSTFLDRRVCSHDPRPSLTT
jgi:hypothetical protein